MSAIDSYFTDFLHEIRLPDDLADELAKAHTELRQRLKDDDITKDLLVDSFVQGSYARSTIIKPEGGHNVDVDVIVVTNIDHNIVTAHEAFDKVLPFVDKYYSEYEQQGRSIGITLRKVDMDLVITAAPSEEVTERILKANLSEAFTVDAMFESANSRIDGNNLKKSYNLDETRKFFESTGMPTGWRDEPLLIPDYDDNKWHRTHPLEQIRWTLEKNFKCNGHYVNVVKAIKWWKRVNVTGAKHPKSYPLEHFVGECCPDALDSVAEGIVTTMETIVRLYPTKPFLKDRGVPEHDVFDKLSDEDYKEFYDAVCEATPIARAAYNAASVETSVNLWRKFFANCDEFPEFNGDGGDPGGDKGESGGGFTPRTQKADAIPTERFAQ